MDFIWAKGSRKTSIARVRLNHGSGVIKVNGKDIQDFLPGERLSAEAIRPLSITNTLGKFDILISVKGGGYNSQTIAIRHGISRGLVKYDETMRGVLKANGFLKRDPRMVERKKYGRKKARKAFQFSKR